MKSPSLTVILAQKNEGKQKRPGCVNNDCNLVRDNIVFFFARAMPISSFSSCCAGMVEKGEHVVCRRWTWSWE